MGRKVTSSLVQLSHGRYEEVARARGGEAARESGEEGEAIEVEPLVDGSTALAIAKEMSVAQRPSWSPPTEAQIKRAERECEAVRTCKGSPTLDYM